MRKSDATRRAARELRFPLRQSAERLGRAAARFVSEHTAMLLDWKCIAIRSYPPQHVGAHYTVAR